MNIKALYISIKRSNEGKNIAKNFGYLSLLQIAGNVFPLITMPYLAKVIGVEGYGKIAFAASIIIWAQTISEWGFTFTATRDIAQNRNNKNKVSQIFSDVLWARCLLALISFAVIILTIFLIPSFYNNSLIILVSFLLVPGQIMFPDWFFQAIEKMKYITLFNLLLKLLFTFSIFIFVKKPEDYILQPLLLSAGYILCGISSLWLIFFKWKYKLRFPNISNSIKAIKNSYDIFLNNLIPNLYNSFSIMLLGSLCGSLASGIYDGGNKFVSVFYQFQNVLSRAVFPFLSRKIDKHNLFVKINLCVGLLFSALLFITAPLIIDIMLSNEFEQSVLVLRILSISLFFLAVTNTYGTNYLIIIRKEKELRNATILASLCGMIIAYPLVYYYSYIGASITILTSRALLGLLTWSFSRKHKTNIFIKSA